MVNTQKIWSEEVHMKYPKQWIVLTEVEYDTKTCKHIGVVYLVTHSKQKAYEVARELGGGAGGNMVVEGFDDTPYIGGLHCGRI